MNILFIYPDLGSFLPKHYQHGIGYLSSVLKKQGHRCGLLYLSHFPNEDELREKIKGFSPDLIAFSATSHQFRYLVKLGRWIKRDFPKTLIICGGVHATLAPEETISVPEIDIVCRGEGEEAIVELAQALEQDRSYLEVENLWIKWKGRVIKNPLRPLIPDLDSLPFPDREVFNYQEILDGDDRRLSLLVGRGCPFDCTYCANQAKKELYKRKGKYVRLRSVDNLLAEIENCSKNYQIKSLDFNDDIFTLNRAWLEEFYEKYPKRFSYPFRINVHCGTVDAEIFQKLKEIGCEMVRIGVESGSERVRREIMNRRISQKQIIKAFEEAEQAGIKTWSFNMVGLPEETSEDALATYNLNRRLAPDHMQVSVFNPYPGTALYQVCLEKGYLKDQIKDGYFVPETALKFPSLSPKEIHNWHQRLVRLGEFFRYQKGLRRKYQDKKILYDLIDELDQAEIFSPVPDYWGEEYLMIYENVYRVLIMHPPTRILYQINLTEPAELNFGILIHPGVYEKAQNKGVIFKVWLGKKPNELIEIFSKYLDAQGKKQDRGVFDFKLDLSSWQGLIFLQLETQPKDPEKNIYNTAGFSSPLLVAKEGGER